MKKLVFVLSLLAGFAAHADPVIPCEEDQFYELVPRNLGVAKQDIGMIKTSFVSADSDEVVVEAYDRAGNLLGLIPGKVLARDCRQY